MPRIRRSTSTSSRRADPQPTLDNLENLTTEVLRLRCDNLQLSPVGSRRTLIARLRAAPRPTVAVSNPPDVTLSTAPTDSTVPSRPVIEESTPNGGFTAEQMETLQSLISSIRDAILPQMSSIHTPPEPTVSPGSSSSLPQHLPPKIITSIRNDPRHVPMTTSVATTTERSLAPATHVHSNTVATDPAASAAIPPLNTMQELRSLAIPNENVNTYINNLSTSTPVNVTYLKHELQFHPNATFVLHLIQGFQEGFRIGFEGPRAPRFSKNLKSAAEHPDLVSKNLQKEVTLGRTAGPFLRPPFPNFQVYPIGVVPKKHSTDWRTIFHLSHPKATGTSVNDHISKDTYSLQYVKIDDAINLIIQLGKGSYMAKTDICSAFRNVPVHPKDWELLGMHWNGLYFFDTVLPFGLRSAPYIFNQLSDAIQWIAKTNYDIRHILHILDDFFLIEPPPRANCMTSLCKLLTLMTNLNVPIASSKTYAASTSLEFLGVLLDSQNMIACLPPDKLERTKVELHNWQSKKSCTLRELQSLIGTLQFACRVIVPGRAFLQRMINLTCGVTEPHHHIKLNSSFQKDVSMWLVFLDQWERL